jgi:anti-sigma regulatory factor (Ser/Thr protein kinase)
VTRETPKALWPSASPPPAEGGRHWQLRDVAELPGVRSELRRWLEADADLRDRLVLALDEMASNALRHGGGEVVAAVRPYRAAWLVEVTDSASAVPPSPAVGRDPSEGGLGLYLIAELATDHGWYVTAGTKHVWALLEE